VRDGRHRHCRGGPLGGEEPLDQLLLGQLHEAVMLRLHHVLLVELLEQRNLRRPQDPA
jgi:hypothetical protein